MNDFEDIVPAPDLPPSEFLPSRYEVIDVNLADGRTGKAALYPSYEIWMAVCQLADLQRWYGLGCTRDEAIAELEAALVDDPTFP